MVMMPLIIKRNTKMNKPEHSHTPSPMMDEPQLQHYVDRLQVRMLLPGLDSNGIPSLEMLRYFDQRARKLRSDFWVGSLKHLWSLLWRLFLPGRVKNRLSMTLGASDRDNQGVVPDLAGK